MSLELPKMMAMNAMFASYLGPLDSCQTIQGGLTNSCYRLTANDKHYFAKVFSEQAIDRFNLETKLLTHAAKSQLAPDLLYIDDQHRFYIQTFITDEIQYKERLSSFEMATALAQLASRCHEMPRLTGVAKLKPIEELSTLQDNLERALACSRQQHKQLREKLAQIQPVLKTCLNGFLSQQNSMEKEHLVLCHGDIHTGNVLIQRTKGNDHCWLIDWEYARYAEPGYELAMIIEINNLPAEIQSQLINQYCNYNADYEHELMSSNVTRYLVFCQLINMLWSSQRYVELYGNECENSIEDLTAIEKILNLSFEKLMSPASSLAN